MNIERKTYLKGQFFVAMPGMPDPNFAKSVSCICEHNKMGAVGVVINRLSDSLTAEDIFEELNINFTVDPESIPIYVGGPVHIDEIFVIHGSPFGWDACLQITPTLGMTNTIDIIEAIAKGKGPEQYLIALGCAGWGPGQIEAEIIDNAWLNCPAVEEIMFKMPVEERWEATLKTIGVTPAVISRVAGSA
ncbi:MAG: YqgE/AlgH family protein [Desulfobacterales bacterium]|nr:YqgE/AlgH family protein [Desulfobacterales bacterium]